MELKDWSYEEFPAFDEKVDGAVIIPTTGNEQGSVVFTDVKYCEMNGTELHLQILLPEDRNHPAMPYMKHDPAADESKRPAYPCIVFVNGSGWFKQRMDVKLGLQSRLADRGYVVAVVEYRHSGIAAFPAPVVDARNAVRFMRNHAADYLIDPEKIILGGDSSGGHTALYAGLYHNDDNPDENLFPGVSAEIKGIISLYASSDFLFEDSNPCTANHNLPDSPEGLEMGGADMRANPELAKKLTVRSNISADTSFAPTLLLHGTKDRTVNCKCSVNLYQHLKNIGKDTQLYLLEGADHGGPEFWTDQVLDIEEDFIKRCL